LRHAEYTQENFYEKGAATLEDLVPHLIKAPRACIDYVLVHELAHLKHHDHGTDFWKLINAHAGDWRKSKHHLDGLVEVVMAE
jgi:predicted metal-dependent hydrolase